MTDQPNILLLMSDEHPVFMTGCYGHRSAKTPALDEFAAGGTVFDTAYCPSPICAPSRAAIMTGRHVHTIEVWDNAAPLRSDWPTFAHSFRAAGYFTALCGKMHFVGPDQLHGFEERWTQDIYPASFEWTRSNRRETAVNPGQNIDAVFACGRGRTPDMDYDDEVFFRATYGLRRIARLSRNRPRPFMLCVSFTGPHYPYMVPDPWWSMYGDEDVDLPEIPEDYRAREHEWVKWLRRHGRFDRLVPDHICRTARRAILGRITLIDDYIGRIRALMEELSLDRDTIVMYLSDHGDMMGEHGLWFKNAAYDWSSRVPWIVSGPDISPRRISETVSLLDLGPTLCGLAGIEPVYACTDGRDLSRLIHAQRPEEAGQAIMENYGEGVWRGWRMIRCGPYKLNYVPGYEPELFDLREDPNEWHNRAADPDLADLRQDLETRVLAGWNHEELDEKRWASEERRLAILEALDRQEPSGWQVPSSAVPHPLRDRTRLGG